MAIDAHHHLWDLSVRDQPWTAELPALRRSFSVEDLRPLLSASGIDQAIVVQTVAEEGETRELLELAAREPEIAGVVGWVDLAAEDVSRRLAALRAAPGGEWLVGVRHSIRDDPDPYWLLRGEVRRGLLAVEKLSLVFELLIAPSQLELAAGVARDFPRLRFVLDHAAQPHVAQGDITEWSRGIVSLAANPNVAVKLSGLINQASPEAPAREQLQPYVDVLLSEFGPRRVLFGSDWPVCLLSGTYGEVVELSRALTAGLDPAAVDAVYRVNAVTWYGLPGADMPRTQWSSEAKA